MSLKKYFEQLNSFSKSPDLSVVPEFEIQNFIGGEFTRSIGHKTLININPSTNKKYSTLPDSNQEDINAAVTSAQNAFASWSRTSPEERSQILNRIADLIDANCNALSVAESLDQGKPLWLSQSVDIPRSSHNFRFFAQQILFAETEAFELSNKAFNFCVRKPIGVAGLISPWNLPLYLLTWKIAPALACGNTVVCKPSEVTPLTAFLLCDLLQEAGLPKGVVNMVFGTGAEAGQALVTHSQVPLISFTGGTQTGQHLSKAAAPLMKKLSLELGGKNANIIFDDSDLDEVIKTSVRSSFLNQGEICLCGSRIFVQEKIYNEFLTRFVDEIKKIQVGNPFDSKNYLGALVSFDHFKKVKSYIEIAKQEGGCILTGEEPLNLPPELAQGYFMRPTVISNLKKSSRLLKEEIFGPVVTVLPFTTEEEIIELNNQVEYGLAASLWTKDIQRVHRLSKELEVGTLWVNTWMMRDLRVPFGGMKKSGMGREGGLHSLEFFTEVTNVCVKY